MELTGSDQPPRYTGPPASTPPPAGWRVPVVIQPPPPRVLPPQDHSAIDAAERLALRVTYAVGAGAGVIALAVACALAGRALG